VRSEIQDAVAAAIDRCERASLVFDLGAIARTMQRVAAAARAADIVPLFAMKSFPHAAVRTLAAEQLAGFDVASAGELREAPAGAIVSIADPSGAALAAARERAGRVIACCETVEQVHAAPQNAEIAIRVSASLTGRDPAIGAVLEGTGRRRSRFGVETAAAVAELSRAAAGRRIGLHVHHGPVVATTAERFVATARAALALADFDPAFVDLGGAWHGVPDLAVAFADVRAALPRLELLVEPGRLYSEGAGFACGRITATRALADRELRVAELSRICHLRWSAVDLVAPPPRTGEGRPVLFVGPTCFEEDVIGEWTVDARVTGRIVVRDVTGYALAWNTGFGGVPPAEVVLVE
jgi:diaminopimelate decarboxylase